MITLGRIRPTLRTQYAHSATRRLLNSGTVHHPPPLPRPSRAVKYARRAAYTAVGLGAAYLTDRELNASAITRAVRTLYTFAVIAADYKLNFSPGKTEGIPALHERVSERMYNLLTSNGGLYIKIGQAIGANAALLPASFQHKFARLFDDAPQVPYETVEQVIRRELGVPPAGPGGAFAHFEPRAVASASVAQVHRARTHDGAWVAVKVQKPDVSKQVEWDLGAMKAVMWLCERWVFDLPMYFMVDFISDHLRRELDFVQEAKNATETTAFVIREPRLRDRVYVPRVYPELSTTKVLTAEWIDGVRLSDRAGVRRLMGEPLDARASSTPQPDVPPYHAGPLTGGTKEIMQSMIDLFCAQIFDWGWVHCDPHPGNVIIRAHPFKPSQPQLVLLDHGLYVRLDDTFRRQYATLWTGLLTLDQRAIGDVIAQWGFGAPDLFASATLMRPVRFRKDGAEQPDEPPLTEYELSVRMKAKLQSFLVDTDKTPKELAFIGRNMRIVQGNNQALGSPVNRIKVMGLWASRARAGSPSLTLSERIWAYWADARFRTALLVLDAAFFMSRVRGWVRATLGGEREGFEDEIERTMRGMAKSNFGIDVAPGVFEG